MAVKEIFILGNPKLYEVSEDFIREESETILDLARDLHDTLMAFRKEHNAGRAIAAPQIGVMKRVIYMFIDKPVVFINPVICDKSDEMIELWDECMSFPGLLVKVKRHKSIRIKYKDENWNDKEEFLSGDLSELLQHEYDHLDGILAVQRSIDEHSLAFKKQAAV
jgi:peptide deformylase